LSSELDVEIWFKRDDLTGLGLGGNKVRTLEFLIGAAEAEGADCLVTGGGPQSNWVMLAALAAVTRNMTAHIVCYGKRVQPSGNLLLIADLPGVEISFTGDPDRSSVDDRLEHVEFELRAAGRRPYVIGRGGATAVGTLGYLTATAEIDGQLADRDLKPHSVWLATGSCGTQAGLVAGHALSGSNRKIVGASVSRPVEECRMRIAELSRRALALIGAGNGEQVTWEVTGDQLDQYGKASPAGAEAAALAARTEGVFLDPVFGAKAMASLIARARTGSLNGPVLFLVTGGAPTLFSVGGPE
jgi:D-cysteine desulfhydrase